MAAAALGALTGTFSTRSQSSERVIPIRARRFTYEPDEITLKLNEPVILEFTSADVVMGFNLPDFGVRSDILPGQKTRLRLVPNKTGSYLFHCDIFCGNGHEDMDGTLHVVA